MFNVRSKATYILMASFPIWQKLAHATLCVVSTDPRSGSIPVVLKDRDRTELRAEDSYSSLYRRPGPIAAPDCASGPSPAFPQLSLQAGVLRLPWVNRKRN